MNSQSMMVYLNCPRRTHYFINCVLECLPDGGGCSFANTIQMGIKHILGGKSTISDCMNKNYP